MKGWLGWTVSSASYNAKSRGVAVLIQPVHVDICENDPEVYVHSAPDAPICLFNTLTCQDRKWW